MGLASQERLYDRASMVSRFRHTARSMGLTVAVGSVAVLSPLASTACFTNACDGDFQSFSGGALVDPNTWQTGPIAGPWLPFPARRTWRLEFPALGRMPTEVIVWVSTVPAPTSGGSFTLASGNTALVTEVSGDAAVVTNDTCSELYVRVVVRAPQLGPGAPPTEGAPSDGGTVGDAGPTEAGASADARAEASPGVP